MAAQAGIVGPDPRLLEKVSASSPWPFTHFGVTVEKDNDAQLGVELTVHLNAEHEWERLGPVVSEIFDGGLLTLQPKEVKANDVLIQVNGVHGDLVSMCRELTTNQLLTLYFVRVDVPQSVRPTGLDGKPPVAAPQTLNKKKAKRGKVWKPKPRAAAESEVDSETSTGNLVEATTPNQAKGPDPESAETSGAALPKGPGKEVAETSEAALSKGLVAGAAAAMQRLPPPCLSAGALLPAAA